MKHPKPSPSERPTEKIHGLTPAEALARFKSRPAGLSDKDAGERLSIHGKNVIGKKRKFRSLRLIANQFNDALVWILLVAAGLAYAFAEYRDVTILLIIVALNAAMGFFQEFKAEKILASIQKLTTDKALIIRNGQKREIDTRLIVPGDILFIAAGDNIPADGYIIESYDLMVNSFIFTGESRPKRKDVGIVSVKNPVLADITNIVFMGETVATGEATCLVVDTGMHTELGHIAHLTQEVKDEPTPLQNQMRVLGRNVTILSVTIGTVVIIAGQYLGMSLYENFLFALALAVSVVPEGLPAAISVALSLGMRRLLKGNVLAKKLTAVETLGSVSIICTDKTGTITRNELTVTRIIIEEGEIEVTGIGYRPEGNFFLNGKKIRPGEMDALERILKIGALCNDASLIHDNGRYKILGDPTEGALIVASRKLQKSETHFSLGETKIDEEPFSSERMRMSVIFKNAHTVSYVKGSPDMLIDQCVSAQVGNKIEPLTEERKETIRAHYNEMSSETLRVLGFAYRELDGLDGKNMKAEAEKGLIWVGMMAMMDPPRAGVGKAIAECRALGIRPIMITGDYELTGRAIAEEVGLIERGIHMDVDPVITGNALKSLTDDEVYERVKGGACVFTRATPEQKLRIASVLKKHGEVIAMTGDGVNDAPALKRADIGVAMGIMGTDVSKEAADMILLDDNFSSIVKGVRQGRTIFSNLRKFVHYVFTSNASELFTVVIGVALRIPSPISAVQILAIDLGTDILPSFALGLEPDEPRLAAKKDTITNDKQRAMDAAGFRRIIYIGIIMAAGAAAAFIWSMLRGGWHFGQAIGAGHDLYIRSTTAAYAVLSMTQMANLLQSRSERFSPFRLGFFKNRYLIGALFSSFFMLLAFMYLPVFQKYLGMAPIAWQDWLVVGISSLAVFGWEEARKNRSRNR